MSQNGMLFLHHEKLECWTWNHRLSRGAGSILTGGNVLLLDFFSRSKASDGNIGIIANFV